MDEVESQARRVLDAHWDARRGHTYPHPVVYPHQWLWDSCFAAICWARLGEHDRARSELATALSGQLASGFVPHMRYVTPVDVAGPLRATSSFTQPPVYAHAARVLAGAAPLPPDLLARMRRGLDWLWTHRRTADGLIFLVHPWESGADDSPRWDSWVAAHLGVADWRTLTWNRPQWTAFDHALAAATRFDEEGAAVGSATFACAPAAFNALTAHAFVELAALTGDTQASARAAELAEAMDELLWDDAEELWADQSIVGGGASCRVPTLDGVLGALVTPDATRAARALEQLRDPRRFAAPYGLAYVARDHPAYAPDGYWRGSAWMQMNYLAALATRRWHRADLAEAIHAMSRASVTRSRFAEHWNPETGAGHGAIPFTWSALVTAL